MMSIRTDDQPCAKLFAQATTYATDGRIEGAICAVGDNKGTIP